MSLTSVPRLFDLTPYHFLTQFDNLMDATWPSGNGSENRLPRSSVNEDEKQISIEIELPGIPKEALNVEIEDRMLTISGNVSEEKRNEEGKVYSKSTRSYRRQFRLPSNVKEEAIGAKYENGLLTIVVPKNAESQVRKLTITGASSQTPAVTAN